MKQDLVLKEVVSKLVTEAIQFQNYEKCLERLNLLKESECYEDDLAITLHETEAQFVKVVESVLELVRRHSYCQFLADIFLQVSQNPKRFLKLQAVILRIVLGWDCSPRTAEQIEKSLDCDAECLSFLLPVVGKYMEEAYPVRLERLFATIREHVLQESLPKALRGKFLDLLLLKTSGWKAQNAAIEMNLALTNGHGSRSLVLGQPSTYSGASLKTFETKCKGKDDKNSEKKDICLLSPSAFEEKETFASQNVASNGYKPPTINQDEDFLAAKVIPTPTYSSKTLAVESPSTFQKMAPVPSSHPQPPQSWLLPNENDSLPSKPATMLSPTFCDYVPHFPNSETASEPIDASSKSSSSTSFFPINNARTTESAICNGARPKTKCEFASESSLDNTNGPSPESLPDTSAFPEDCGLDSSYAKYPLYPKRQAAADNIRNIVTEHQFPCKNFPKDDSASKKLSWNVESSDPRPEKEPDFGNMNGNTRFFAFSSGGRSDAYGSDEEDIVVEKVGGDAEDKKSVGKRKIKWAPFKAANIIDIKPSKPARLPVITKRDYSSSDHPFLTSDRMCSICGDKDHLHTACKKSMMSSLFPDYN